jgi:hypothetical protein
LRVVDRCEADEALGELDPLRVRVDVSEPVEEDLRLLANGPHDIRMGVADGGHPEAGGHIYIEVAVDVPDVRAVRLLPEDGRLALKEGVDPRSFELAEAGGEGA